MTPRSTRYRPAVIFAMLAAGASANPARAADIVLPAASLAEKEGTFTNVQGRVQKFERAFLAKPPVRAHWEMLLMLATSLGFGDRNWTPSDLIRRIAAEVPDYGHVDPAELEGGILLKKGDFVWMGAP